MRCETLNGQLDFIGLPVSSRALGYTNLSKILGKMLHKRHKIGRELYELVLVFW